MIQAHLYGTAARTSAAGDVTYSTIANDVAARLPGGLTGGVVDAYARDEGVGAVVEVCWTGGPSVRALAAGGGFSRPGAAHDGSGVIRSAGPRLDIHWQRVLSGRDLALALAHAADLEALLTEPDPLLEAVLELDVPEVRPQEAALWSLFLREPVPVRLRPDLPGVHRSADALTYALGPDGARGIVPALLREGSAKARRLGAALS